MLDCEVLAFVVRDTVLYYVNEVFTRKRTYQSSPTFIILDILDLCNLCWNITMRHKSFSSLVTFLGHCLLVLVLQIFWSQLVELLEFLLLNWSFCCMNPTYLLAILFSAQSKTNFSCNILQSSNCLVSILTCFLDHIIGLLK